MAIDNEFSLLFLYAIFFTARANFDPYSDNTRFAINFPGPLQSGETDTLYSVSDFQQDGDSVVLLTERNEKYKCIIPDTTDSQSLTNSDGSEYKGPSEEDLLSSLLQQSSCSYKIEPYWTYELCHNKYIRQYHEEREAGKDIKLQEYYLGYYKTTDDIQTEVVDSEKESDKINMKQIGGMDLPFYKKIYTDGTICDLSKQPRKTSVLYICHELGRGEIYELKEVSSCEYEVVILTQLLCSHPDYVAHKEKINKIRCHSLEDAPRRPIDLSNFELENAQARYNRPGDEEFEWEDVDWESEFGMTLEAVQKFIAQVKEEQDQLYPKTQIQKPPVSHTPVHQTKDTNPASSPATGPATSPARKSGGSGTKTTSKDGLASTDKQLLRDFFSGEYCIQGGTGWWKHEFCYGRKVTQYHEDNSGKTVITLGTWNEQEHMEWIEQHPTKRPRHVSSDNHIVHHYYGGGDMCELTGKHRSVEVKLRCRENVSNPHSVSIYLLETRTCVYSLVVESPVLCSVLEKADNDGLIASPFS